MNYPITHVTVKETPPPQRPVMTVGQIYPLYQKQEPEVVFRTVTREVDEEEVDEPQGEPETKVMRGRRPTRPKANQVAETK